MSDNYLGQLKIRHVDYGVDPVDNCFDRIEGLYP